MEKGDEIKSDGLQRPPGYIVVKEEYDDEPLELELEEDGNLRMSTLISQFSGACGLRFRNKETGAMRGVRVNNDLFLPPNGAMGWPTDVTFNVVYSKDNAANREKRKILDQNPEVEFAQSQPPKRATQKPSDLAVLSIPWKTTEEELKQHFSKFGNIVFANIKKDPETGNSRGFGFIRFENYESQKKAMEEATHEIDGRAVVLRLTKKGENGQFRKVFVGRLSTELTRSDLMDYFSQFGTITDITIPQPFRSFAFITFQESSDAISILDQDHLIKGVSVVTRSADPIQEPNKNSNRNNPPQNQYYSNHNNGAQSPNRGVQPALTGYNRGNNGSSIQPPAEVIQHAVNRAVQQYLGQMGGYGKRPFVDDSSFATGYQTQKSPQHGSGGHSPIHPSGLYGFSNPPQSSALQASVRTTGVTRSSKTSYDQSSSWGNGGTSPGHNPWDSNDPQSKNYTNGKSWL